MQKVEAIKTLTAAEIKPGMLVRVHQKIKEINPKGEEKERVQMFEGLVIKHRAGASRGATITVRKISEGVGVEKIFPLDLPALVKIELVSQFKVRRSKLYFVRDNPKRMKEMIARPKTPAAAKAKTPAKA